MNWTTTAILSAAVFAMMNVIDSHLLSKRLPSLPSFLLPLGAMDLIFGFILFCWAPLPAGIGIWPILVAVGSGLLRAVAMMLMVYNLKREEVSRVIPIYHTSPVFVAIIAVLLLGESLGYLQWLAVIIVVAGAIIISIEKSPPGSAGKLARPFLLLFLSSLCLALSDTTSKYALAYIAPLNMYAITVLCLAGVFWVISLRPSTIRQLGKMERRNSSLTMVVISATLSQIAMVLMFWAIEGGPVSLVATIMAARPIFIILYSVILGLILPGFLLRLAGKKTLILRFVATIMIVGGVSIIYLT